MGWERDQTSPLCMGAVCQRVAVVVDVARITNACVTRFVPVGIIVKANATCGRVRIACRARPAIYAGGHV